MNISRGISFFSPYLLGAFAIKHGLGAAIGLTAGFYLVGLIAVIIMPDSRRVDAERSLST
jgi:dipeptide/tripeptide permease